MGVRVTGVEREKENYKDEDKRGWEGGKGGEEGDGGKEEEKEEHEGVQ